MQAKDLKNLLLEKKETLVKEQVNNFLEGAIKEWLEEIENGVIPLCRADKPRFILPSTFSEDHKNFLKKLGYDLEYGNRDLKIVQYLVIKE